MLKIILNKITHIHTYKIIKREFVPSTGLFLTPKYNIGETVITYVCEGCGKIKQSTFYGDLPV